MKSVMRVSTLLTIGFAVAVGGSTALGSVMITQGTSAPTYSITLTFDEPGGPTGQVPTDAWAASHGISSLNSGDGVNRIVADPGNYGWTWAGGDYAFIAPWGTFINFANDLTELSAQVWDDSGPGGPFGGGMFVGAYNDGLEVALVFVDPAWGGLGLEWFNFTTTDGSVFDEVRFVGNNWIGPTNIVDNLSWNLVPEPASLALLALAAVIRRR